MNQINKADETFAIDEMIKSYITQHPDKYTHKMNELKKVVPKSLKTENT